MQRNLGHIEMHTKCIVRARTNSDWALFLDSWDKYKAMSNITDINMLLDELRCTCSPEVNKMLFDLIGGDTLKTCDEHTPSYIILSLFLFMEVAT